jgi:uncharacterized protein YndB with AHSA1/START domain
LTGADGGGFGSGVREENMRLFIAAACLAGLLWATPASAEVAAAGPSGFQIQAQAEVAATPERIWRALLRPGQWWGSDHTYSGDARRRMSLEPRAGGCWCERWEDGQTVEHGRVVLMMERDGVRTLRIQGALGPLQEMGVSGVLTFTIAPHPAGAKIDMTYRVAGDAGLGLDQLAPLVDMVLMEQFGRLGRYGASGSPD